MREAEGTKGKRGESLTCFGVKRAEVSAVHRSRVEELPVVTADDLREERRDARAEPAVHVVRHPGGGAELAHRIPRRARCRLRDTLAHHPSRQNVPYTTKS